MSRCDGSHLGPTWFVVLVFVSWFFTETSEARSGDGTRSDPVRSTLTATGEDDEARKGNESRDSEADDEKIPVPAQNDCVLEGRVLDERSRPVEGVSLYIREGVDGWRPGSRSKKTEAEAPGSDAGAAGREAEVSGSAVKRDVPASSDGASGMKGGSTEMEMDAPVGWCRWRDTGLRSDAHGRFTLHLSESRREGTFLLLDHERYKLVQLIASETVEKGDNRYDFGTITLESRRFVAGKVVDRHGEPVAGAWVGRKGMPWDDGDRGFSDRYLHTITDNHGEFLLSSPGRFDFRIKAYREGVGFARSLSPVPGTWEDPPSMELRLEALGSIAGILVDAGGRPLSGVTLKAVPDDPKECGFRVAERVVTGDEGAFRFTRLPAGCRYDIVLESMDVLAGISDEWTEFLTLSENLLPGTDGLVLEVPARGVELEIRLKPEDDGDCGEAPIIAIMSLYRKDNGLGVTTASLGNGLQVIGRNTYLCRHVPPCSCRVEVHAEGYRQTAVERVELPAGSGRRTLEIVLERAGILEGEVILATGIPARGAVIVADHANRSDWIGEWDPSFTPEWVVRNSGREQFVHSRNGLRLRSRLAEQGMTTRTAITDEGGRFRFDIKTFGDYHLICRYRGREVHECEVIHLDEAHPDKRLRIELPGLDASITGRVRDRDGKPVAGACVAVWNGGSLFNHTYANDEGDYRLDGLPGGAYVADARKLNVSADRDSVHYAGTIPFSSEGSAFSGASRHITIAEGIENRVNLVVTDPWTARIAGEILGTGDLRPDRIDIDLGLHDGSGKKVSFTARPDDLFVYRGATRSRYSRILDEIGRFAFDGLASGHYRIAARWNSETNASRAQWIASGGMKRHTPVQWEKIWTLFLGPGEQAFREFHFPVANLEGRALNALDLEGIEGVGVTLQCLVGEYEGVAVTTRSDRDGGFYIHHVPAARYALTLDHEGFERWEPMTIDLSDQERWSGMDHLLNPKETQ